MAGGLAGYASFPPPGWCPPEVSDETKQALAARFAGPEAWGLLALADDEPAGIVSISRIIRVDVHPAPPGSAYVWQMFVRPAWQGSGLAQALIDRALAEAHARGFKRVVLWTPRDQAQARRF